MVLHEQSMKNCVSGDNGEQSNLNDLVQLLTMIVLFYSCAV